jgi:hypothetical protein
MKFNIHNEPILIATCVGKGNHSGCGHQESYQGNYLPRYILIDILNNNMKCCKYPNYTFGLDDYPSR